CQVWDNSSDHGLF
nr:immunoglobulin light chain junction region [Macaca mulatta]MPN65798.1 immunoglobulin light chain junction region [Macaca mulatta]MPN66357.1 immunoglobulin light chain junction region [Macaca mulatta]